MQFHRAIGWLSMAAAACCVLHESGGASGAPPAPLEVRVELPEWQGDVWSKIDVYGRFVRGSQLESDPLFGALAPSRSRGVGENPSGDESGDAAREEIYLLTLCRPRENPGKRVLAARAVVEISDVRSQAFEIVSSGFLDRGEEYCLVKVVDSDSLLPERALAGLLASRPELTIVQARIK